MLFAEKTKATILPLYIYPEFKLFKKSIVYIGGEYNYEQYSKFESRERAVSYIQNKIEEYSKKDYTNKND